MGASNQLGYNGGRVYSFFNRPVLMDCNFVVDSANGNGLGIRNLKGSGIQNVFMHTSSSAGKGPNGYLNPNPASGYALVQLANNYNRYGGGFSGFVSPLSGSNVAINASALTVGNPYVITSVGHAASGTVTIAPVADTAGSLASTWFRLFDAYGNTFIIWFNVAGVGSAPVGVSGTLVQQSIASGATAAQVGTALVLTIENLPSGIAGVNSFTASGTTTVTVVSTQTNPQGPLPGAPQDGTIATGFTFAQTVYNTNLTCWQGVGLPAGVSPAVGASFIATTQGVSTHGGSTGLVQAPSISGITSMEVIGDANASLGPIPMGGSRNVGGWIMVQFLAPTNSSTTTLIPTAPADGSIVGMSFYVEAGSILINGQ
jgi:hypothetical protein